MGNGKLKMFYTIFVFVALAAFDNIIVGLFPPLFSSIAKELKVDISLLGIISAVTILFSALSSVYWSYLSGKYSRKKLIIIGTVIWSISVFMASQSTSYMELLITQVFTGLGLGCISSIGFSILTDYIPYKYRGMILSLWGMAQGFGGVLGSLVASLIGTAKTWRTPFFLVGAVGLLLAVLYLFVEEPALGESEPELKEFIKEGYEYKYDFEFNGLRRVFLKKSNILLLVQGFFMNIANGSLIWLPTLYISKIQHEGYSLTTAVIASGYIYALFQVGGTATPIFGYLGDVVQRKSYKGRALLTSFFVFLTVPLYILAFIVPMHNLSLPENNAVSVLIGLVKQVFINPWIGAIFILSFAASAVQSSNIPNCLALITETNLPEYRGTVFSAANLANSLGKTIGNIGVGFVLSFAFRYIEEPNNYVYTLIVFQLFLVLCSLCYLFMAKSNVNDIYEVKKILRDRVQSS